LYGFFGETFTDGELLFGITSGRGNQSRAWTLRAMFEPGAPVRLSGRPQRRTRASVRIDHVIYGTADLDLTAMRLQAELGLVAIDGGRHEGLGTRLRIVPLEDGSFLALMAVADPEAAKHSALGAALQAAIARREGLLGWAVAVNDLEPVVQRLGTPISTVARPGETARLTGLAECLPEPCLPFFVERCAVQAAPRAADARGIRWIEVAGDAVRLRRWLGGAELPVLVVDGQPAVRAVGIGDQELTTE
jgi:hypothetical protein